MEHEKLGKSYYGNNGSRRIAVTYRDDWYELPGDKFDWGNMSSGCLRLAAAILRDMGMSPAMVLRYAQKLMINVLSLCPHERALVIDEVDILNGVGCKAIDDLCGVSNGED